MSPTFKPNTFAKCYFCDKFVLGLPEIKNGKKFARKVVFCDSRCFQAYLAANRPLTKIVDGSALDIAQRALTRLEDIKAEILFDKPDSDRTMVEEEVIYELMFIINGKEEVTKGERYECLRQLCPAPPARRL